MTNSDAYSPTPSLVEITALSSGETTVLTFDREDAIKLLHSTASTWFNLVPRPGRASTEFWDYFHAIYSVIYQSKLHAKYIGNPHLSCCNLHDKVFSYSSSLKCNVNGNSNMTSATIESHLILHNVSFGERCVIIFVLFLC